MISTVLVPAMVRGCLDNHGLNHRPILLALDTDVDLAGRNARQWLVITPDHYSLVEESTVGSSEPKSLHGTTAISGRDTGPSPTNPVQGLSLVNAEEAPYGSAGSVASGAAGLSPGARLLRHVATAEVTSARTHTGVGSGVLQLKIDGQWIDWLRYSNAMATRFHKVSRMIERYCEQGYAAELLALVPSEDSKLDPHRCPKCNLRLNSATESCPRCVPKGQIARRVIDLLRPYRRGALMLCALTVVGVAAELIPPKLQQTMVDNILTTPIANHTPAVATGSTTAITTGSTTSSGPDGAVGQVPPVPVTEQVDFKTALLVVVLALAMSRVLLSVVAVFKGHLATRIGTGLTSTLRAQMVEKLQKLAIAYYDRHQVGSMLSRVAHDSEVLHGLMHQFTGGFLLQIVQLFGVGAMLLWINPKLAMFTLIPVPLVFLGSWIFWRKVYPRHYRLWDASSKQMSVLSGMLSGIRVVKAFAQEDREFARFRTASDQLRDWRLWVESTNANYSAAMQIVFSLGGLIVWYVGGRDVIGHDMTLGQLIAFLAYLAMFYAPLSALSSFTTWLTSFLSGSQRVLELLDTPLAIDEPKQPQAWNDPQGAIRFTNVSFGYDRNQPVLKNISFDVAAGEMVGIVGRSGSGKTTMVNLLGRFYDVQEGSITVDGIDIRNISRQQLRERLGIVFQDSFLFRGTIWKNLSYGKPDTLIEAGISAAKAAGAHDFICRQSLAYETLLGEHGAGLSGGEKQRLSIARTLLYDPRILVLDEATSNIDAEAERSIQQALEVLIRGRTTVAIAHRLSTLRNADRILVFDRGMLAEQGSHTELLNQDGIYAKLVRMQTQVTKAPSVDSLLTEPTATQARAVESGSDTAVATLAQPTVATKSRRIAEPSIQRNPTEELEPKKNFIQWLDPNECQFKHGPYGQLEVWRHGECIGRSVFVLRTFPATHRDAYLSIRGWCEGNEEIEVGMIRQLENWSAESQQLINESLDRRYLLREIKSVSNITLSHGFLNLEVDTNSGPQRFTMRWTQSQAMDFGDNGKLMIDSEENRYLVRDIDALPARDRERFLQYVYW
ncbi:MAG: DUF1854 domain-containing protein [Pirellulaceae bacterium]|nr:DUF1854 domain-containing protein [Pirellulaceae bacterium]